MKGAMSAKRAFNLDMYVASVTQTIEGLSKGDLSPQKSPSRVRFPEAMYMSRLKAFQRAACQLKKSPSRVRKFRKQCMCRGRTPFEGRPVNSKRPFKGSSSGNNVHVEVEGPSKGGLSTQKSPSRVQVLEAKYYMSRLKALEGHP